jgi:small-conductance mechanosensitive channel
MKHPLQVDNRSPEEIQENKPEVMVRVVALANFSVTLKAWVWAENAANGFELSCDLLYSIKTRFDQEGIEIPYPYQNVILKGGALPEER